MKQGPEIAVAFENNMCATATIPAIRTTQRREFIAHEMFVTGATMTAPAKYSNLIYKVALLQSCNFTGETAFHNPDNYGGLSAGCKYSLTMIKRFL